MIASLLARWSAKRPEECRQTDYWFYIGEYRFHIEQDTLSACYDVNAAEFVSVIGQPALDWLRGSVERAIEAAGLDYEYRFIAASGSATLLPRHRVTILSGNQQRVLGLDKIEALLTSYVEYLEGQR